VTSAQVTRILADVRSNRAKLDGCVGPHDFSIEATPGRTFGRRLRCSKCRGDLDAVHVHYYNAGLKHGRADKS
jgi:hypothetical protein